MMFDVLESLPSGFESCSAAEIQSLFPRPTLVHLRGIRPEPVFVSVLLHGNEDVGLLALQEVMRRSSAGLPRSLSIFIGNVTAAGERLRRLPGQVDYNRVWPGTENAACPESEMMASVVEQMRQRRVFASIDLHNNTGTNPHYACICTVADQHMQLASLFSRTVVYFTRPRGVQTMAFSGICPAVTCECGKIGDASGVRQAADLVLDCLHLQEFPMHPVAEGEVHLFHTVATVKVPPEVTIGFGQEPGELVFPADLDRMNFCEVGPGTELACRAPHSRARLEVLNEAGRDVFSEYLSEAGNSLRIKKQLLPSMLTLDPRIIRQDCLCYFMERYPTPGPGE